MKKIISTFLVGVMLLYAITGCGSKNENAGINLMDYAAVSFDGDNGEGTANVDVDYDSLETDMVGGQDKVDALELEDAMKYLNAVEKISYSFDKSDNLSNGDTIVLTVSYDETTVNEAGVIFDDTLTKEYTVSGLK